MQHDPLARLDRAFDALPEPVQHLVVFVLAVGFWGALWAVAVSSN